MLLLLFCSTGDDVNVFYIDTVASIAPDNDHHDGGGGDDATNIDTTASTAAAFFCI